jgi:ectoine hydroxylase-related dioxygenase (phytanoyl-CoA dioxygenase family)
MDTALAAADLETYQRLGYALPTRPVYPAADFERLRALFARLLPRWVDDHGQRPESMDKPHFLFPELFEFLLHDAVLDLVEPLIGPDFGLFTSHFICKPARTGQRVPWHEDSSYWKGLFDRIDDVCTVWVALDRSDKENGCLRVIAGSHVGGYSAYEPVPDPANAVFGTEIRRDQVDESRAVDFELDPNRCSIHHARIIHGSDANRSERRRCGLTIRFFSTRCRFRAESMPPSFRVYLARGRDHAGNRYGEPRGVNQDWLEQVVGKLPPTHL